MKSGLKDKMLNVTNIIIEVKRKIESSISVMAETFFKLYFKEKRSIIINNKNTPVGSLGFLKRNYDIDVE